MKKHLTWQAFAVHLGVTLSVALLPLGIQANPSSATNCNILVSISNDLYLVNSTGKELVQFTSDGAPKSYVSLSPNGHKVAYATSNTASAFTVADNSGQQGSFWIDLNSNSYLMGLDWDSNDVLRVTKFWGKDEAQFDFRRISDDLTLPASAAAKSTTEQNCVIKDADGPVACIDRGGSVSFAGGVNEKYIYSIPVFSGIAPLQSLDAHVGETVAPKIGPPYQITVEKIAKDKLTIVLDQPGTSYGSEAYIDNGSYTTAKDYKTGAIYAYFATIINAKTGLVRIDVVKSDTPDKPVDMALVWQPRGQGLLFIQRTNTQTFLDLIQPGRGDVSGYPVGGQSPQWHLAAQTPVSLPGQVRSMRFLVPSLLLLNTGDFRGPQFSELPIHLANGQDNGRPSLTVGTVQPLPNTLSVTINGKNSQASVLDWSCNAPSESGD